MPLNLLIKHRIQVKNYLSQIWWPSQKTWTLYFSTVNTVIINIQHDKFPNVFKDYGENCE